LIEQAISDLFHDALDREDVSAPFQRLQIELEKPGAAHRRAGRRIFMTRNRLVLLAAALVLVLGISVVVSARLLNVPRVGQTINAAPDKTTVAQLLARPLLFSLRPGLVTCPNDGPITDGLFGAGPVYGAGGHADTTTNWGAYDTGMVITPSGMQGPVVLRGENLITGQPMVTYGKYTAGPVYRTDLIGGKTTDLYTASALDTAHPPAQTYPFLNATFHEWLVKQGWPHNTGFCAGLQIDGPDFSEQIYATVGAA